MKKTYLAPETEVMTVQNVGIIALSKGSGNADDSEVLVKGEHHSLSLDIWGEGSDDEDEYSDGIFN